MKQLVNEGQRPPKWYVPVRWDFDARMRVCYPLWQAPFEIIRHFLYVSYWRFWYDIYFWIRRRDRDHLHFKCEYCKKFTSFKEARK